eukprot:CAMPEP_0174368264 /NCGR_PEP_ID=MMETSP0811_2-20130205/88455_1 /TAXON_ID=73025 ORGANISM="Eutreptiella gymnastica-like, Strain CCMP1594" /NCGR_SAMPLE_ID=MMETSP0811_2 /ASSEMBLY_ACC=CAM_ASM_000667 /LENGTH=45 /DNA_ID= /DNA_START= /DNA_END= /DNA_ORIENTATION=
MASNSAASNAPLPLSPDLEAVWTSSCAMSLRMANRNSADWMVCVH